MQQRHSNLILENIAIRTRLLLYILGAIMVSFLIWGLFERKLYDKDVFTFNEQYEMISFITNDRAATGTDGSMEYIPWSAICSDYKSSENGIKHPTKFQAVWNYPDEDFVYFDGIISEVTCGYAE